MPREGPKRGYAIIIRQALKRWRGPQEAGGGWSSLLSFQVFFSFFFSSIFYCLQLSTNHFILTILVWNGFHSDRFARRSLGVLPPGTLYSVLISNRKSQIFYCLHYWFQLLTFDRGRSTARVPSQQGNPLYKNRYALAFGTSRYEIVLRHLEYQLANRQMPTVRAYEAPLRLSQGKKIKIKITLLISAQAVRCKLEQFWDWNVAFFHLLLLFLKHPLLCRLA